MDAEDGMGWPEAFAIAFGCWAFVAALWVVTP
jgi:hypothetical protein